MIAIKSVQTRQEAEVLKSFLKANGITAFITADDRGGVTPPPFSPVPEVKIFVSPVDVQRAKTLIELKHTA